VPHDERPDATVYRVVVNHEEQYSIWPTDREIPNGWRDAGRSGSRDECLAHIREVWTDMRPLSLRRAMSQAGSAPRGDRDGAGV
jgi:MbtH protein